MIACGEQGGACPARDVDDLEPRARELRELDGVDRTQRVDWEIRRGAGLEEVEELVGLVGGEGRDGRVGTCADVGGRGR